MRKKIVAIILVVVISSGLVGVYYELHNAPSPHLGAVSQQTLSKFLNESVVTSTNITSNNTSYAKLPNNATAMYGRSYYLSNGSLGGNIVLLSIRFNSLSNANKYYTYLKSNSFTPQYMVNDTFRGFTYTWYGDEPVNSSAVPFSAAGIDGNYFFVISSLTFMSSTRANVGGIIHYQIDSML